jgi:Fur family peroxide stress response transcriptional regulator
MLADLKRAGLKLTPQRIAIVRELDGDETHPTAQELYERLLPAFPTMSFATVYNTLAALERAGVCQTAGLSSLHDTTETSRSIASRVMFSSMHACD